MADPRGFGKPSFFDRAPLPTPLPTLPQEVSATVWVGPKWGDVTFGEDGPTNAAMPMLVNLTMWVAERLREFADDTHITSVEIVQATLKSAPVVVDALTVGCDWSEAVLKMEAGDSDRGFEETILVPTRFFFSDMTALEWRKRKAYDEKIAEYNALKADLAKLGEELGLNEHDH